VEHIIDLLLVIAKWVWRRLQIELPNCPTVLEELRTGKRSKPLFNYSYVWLCWLTGMAQVMRGIAYLGLVCFVIVLAPHFHLALPFFSFDDHHIFYFAISEIPKGDFLPAHYCVILLASSLLLAVAGGIFYDRLGWLSWVTEKEYCPLADGADSTLRAAATN
jgi:hypothetical protein